MRWFAVMMATVLATNPVMGQDKPSPKLAAPTDIETALMQLGDADFAVREAASQRLVARGISAVGPVTETAVQGNTEASVRAFDILKELYRYGDDATCEAIETALESLIRSDNVSVVTRAELSYDTIGIVRHHRAIDHFVQLGGVLRYLTVPAGAEVSATEKYELPIQYALLGKTWKGGDEGLRYLRRIEDFRTQSDVRGASLYVIKGSVSDNALADLERILPNLPIQKRGPACLGVTPGLARFFPMNETQGLQLAVVKEGSAAALAGLRENDILMKFNGHEVNDFETLVDKIAELQPGDKVPVVYLRGNTTTTTIVELRGWD